MGPFLSSKQEASLCSQRLLPGQPSGGRSPQADSFSRRHVGTYYVQDGGQGEVPG